MRFRYSLRMSFLLLALVSGICYVWLARPSQLAQRFADAINTEDFPDADRVFRRPTDGFLADWSDSRWAFRARCDLRPLTIGQLLTGRRYVNVHIEYFELDHTAIQSAEIAATPFGMTAPTISSVEYGGMFINEVRESAVRELQR